MFKSKLTHFILSAIVFFCLIASFNPIFAKAGVINDVLVAMTGSVSSDLGTPAGSLDLTQKAQIVVTLNPNNSEDLEKYVNDIQDPSSPNYRKILTDSAFSKSFAPSPSNVTAVINYYKNLGLTQTYQSTSNLILGFSGTLVQLNTAFGTTSEFRTNTAGMSGRINTTTFKIPTSLWGIIQGVVGFDKLHAPKNNGTKPTLANDASKNAISYSSPANLRKAYGFPSDLTGTGTSVGIVLWAAPNTSDVTRWKTANSITGNVTVLPAGTAASTDDTLRFEANMDVQLVLTAAPNTNVRFYTATANSYDALAISLQQAIDDNVSAITNSWGGCESTMTTTTINSYHTIFQNAAAKGIPVVFSSGDNGSFDCNSSGAVTKTGFTQFPSADALVTSVGGTSLDRDSSTYAWLNETAWSCKTTDGSADTSCLQANGGSSSGGSTINYPRPSFQAAVSPAAETKFTNKTTNTRLQPDISLNADPKSGIKIFFTSSYCNDNCLSGGTSAAAPFLGGILALAAQKKGAAVGGINTFLYTKFSTTWGYDVTSGYNGVSAKTGWDYTTGLGSIKNVSNFINAVLGLAPSSGNSYYISTLFPASVPVKSQGGKTFTLSINGKAFTSSSKIFWNGAVRATTYINANLLTATITDTDLGSSGTASVTVANAANDSTVSNALTVTISASCQSTVVTRLDDTYTCGTLRYALASVGSSGTVSFALLAGSQITMTGAALTIPTGVNMTGVCTPNGPGVTLQGSGTNSTLTINGSSTLFGLALIGFGNGGTQIKVANPYGKVVQNCVKIKPAN